MKQFEVGEIYEVIALYGGFQDIKIVKRTDDTVTVKHGDHQWCNQIRWRGKREVLPIIVDKEHDCEKVLAWEYKGENCYYGAKINNLKEE